MYSLYLLGFVLVGMSFVIFVEFLPTAFGVMLNAWRNSGYGIPQQDLAIKLFDIAVDLIAVFWAYIFLSFAVEMYRILKTIILIIHSVAGGSTG